MSLFNDINNITLPYQIIFGVSIISTILFCYAGIRVLYMLFKQDKKNSSKLNINKIGKKLDNVIKNENDDTIKNYFNEIRNNKETCNFHDFFVTFDENNKNSLCFYKGNKFITSIVCPPNQYGIDLININEKEFIMTDGYYKYDYRGLVVITVNHKRYVFYKGTIINKST